jgi:amino acid transporter
MTVAPETGQRPFGFWRSWSLVVGVAIGSGIFMMPALLAPYGLLGLAGWLVSGTGAVLVALTLARLSRRLPRLGGPYAYARGGLGELAGFLVAWGYWICVWSGMAAITVACVGYIGHFVPPVTRSPVLSLAVGLALLWGLTLLNLRSSAGSGGFQLATTLLKIAPLVLIAVLGLAARDAVVVPAWNPAGLEPLPALASAAVLTMWALVGIESVTVPADTIRDPGRTIPRALIAGTVTVLVLYLAASAAVMFVTPPEVLARSTAPFADAATRLIGPVGAGLIAAGAIVSTLGSLNGNLLIVGPTLLAPAREGLMPTVLARTNARGAPVVACVISSLLSSLLLVANYTKGLVEAFRFMILLSTLTTLIPFTFAAAAELAFVRRDHAAGDRSPRLARTALLAALSFVVTLFVIAGSGQETVFWGVLLLLGGLPVFALVRRAPRP